MSVRGYHCRDRILLLFVYVSQEFIFCRPRPSSSSSTHDMSDSDSDSDDVIDGKHDVTDAPSPAEQPGRGGILF